MWVFVVPMFLCAALGLLGIDRFNTLSNSSLASCLVVGWTVLLLVLSLRAYFMSDHTSDRVERLKQDNKFTWTTVGIAFAAMLSGMSGFVFDQLVKAAAQHLPGESFLLSGQVVAVQRTSGRGACRFYVTVSSTSDREDLHTCMQTATSAALGPIDIEPGQRVILQLRDTVLGTVLLEITRE